jgi:hypothetical protein
MEPTELVEELTKFLPSYLRDAASKALAQTVAGGFPDTSDPNKVYNDLPVGTPFLQGDAIRDVPFAMHDPITKETFDDEFDAIVLSNSCDISMENRRFDEPLVSFGIVIPLSLYEDSLRAVGIAENRAADHLKDVRANKISSLLYLPNVWRGANIIRQEMIARLDWVYSLPNGTVQKWPNQYLPEGDRIFSLSNYGFYVLLYKLSVHFSRIREEVDRG